MPQGSGPCDPIICFRYWEFWSLGGSEDFYNLLRNSKTPSLPVAKAIINVMPCGICRQTMHESCDPKEVRVGVSR